MRAKNPYSLSQLSVLKQELTNNLDYVVDFIVAGIEDDIDYKPTAKGGIAPVVVSTIEAKLKTCISVITQCSKIVLSIYDKEGIDPKLTLIIGILVDKLKEIQLYYEGSPINLIEHRKITYTGYKKPITFIASTKEQQIQARQAIYESILKLLPLIEQLESVKNEITVKGDYQLPERFQYLINV